MCNIIFEQFPEAEVIAGVATAGVAWGAMAADQLKLPYVYVRPKPKGHGLGNQVEGLLEEGKKVVVVEDLVSTGMSSLAVVEVLRVHNADVVGMVSIFSYGFEHASKAFTDAAVKLVTLTDYTTLIDLAIGQQKIDPAQQNTLLKWRSDPAGWTGI